MHLLTLVMIGGHFQSNGGEGNVAAAISHHSIVLDANGNAKEWAASSILHMSVSMPVWFAAFDDVISVRCVSLRMYPCESEQTSMPLFLIIVSW